MAGQDAEKRAKRIQEYEQVRVRVADLKFDGENPNRMTEAQVDATWKSFKKFGNLHPIVIDQNNFIVHGNHRAQVYRDMGLAEIPAIRRRFRDDNERRMCSQTLNKLHGEYDTTMDVAQLTRILEGNRLEELAELLAKPNEDLMMLIGRHGDGFQPREINQMDGVETKNKCPSCGYEW